MISDVTQTGFSTNRIIAASFSQQAGRLRPRDGELAERKVEPTTAPTEPTGKSELTEAEKKEVEKLRTRDDEVRTHEQAHKQAAGAHASGGPSYEFETGPDGGRYAVDGSVQIDLSEVAGDPQATIRKMQQVQRAALAPAEPSAADRQVAAKASAIEQEARTKQAEGQADQTESAGPSKSSDAEPTETIPVSDRSGQSASQGRIGPDSNDKDDATSGASLGEGLLNLAESVPQSKPNPKQAAQQPEPASASLVAGAFAQTYARLDAPATQARAASVGRFVDVTV